MMRHRWRDVLVQKEEIARIVGPFDLNQAVATLVVVASNPAVVIVLHEVDVTAGLRIRRQSLVVVAQPLDPFIVLRSIGLSCQEYHAVGGVAVGKGGVVGSNAMTRSVDRIQMHRAGQLKDPRSVFHVCRLRSVRKSPLTKAPFQVERRPFG